MMGAYSFGLLSLMEGEIVSEAVMDIAEWVHTKFEVASNSGCADNMCHPGDDPGYQLQASPGSTCGQNFVVGNGAKILNT